MLNHTEDKILLFSVRVYSRCMGESMLKKIPWYMVDYYYCKITHPLTDTSYYGKVCVCFCQSNGKLATHMHKHTDISDIINGKCLINFHAKKDNSCCVMAVCSNVFNRQVVSHFTEILHSTLKADIDPNGIEPLMKDYA